MFRIWQNHFRQNRIRGLCPLRGIAMTNDWKFSTLEYTRPDVAAAIQTITGFTDKVRSAASAADVLSAITDLDAASSEFMTMVTICSVRHTLNTKDEFYQAEYEYIMEQLPTMNPAQIAFQDAVAESPFRPDVEAVYGKQIFVKAELAKKSFTEANIPLMQRESKLCTEYENMMAGAEIPFEGETLNLYGIQKHFEDEDREKRRAAYRAYEKFYADNEPRLEEIWDELIKIRTEMGRNLGFDSFIPLGYMQQGRTDYGQEEVASFRAQVLKELVPFCSELYEAQAKRLGLVEVMAYDEKRVFPDGNAHPAGDDDFMIRNAQSMYHDISPETGEFIDFMIDHELMDLKNKPGKASTGYMTFLPSLKAPFVFSCFNGTIFDMEVLSHELGHAFAGYMSMRNQPIFDFCDWTTDIAEIHSMAMEQFAYPYAERFFGDDADKYRFQHLQEAITFVPFGVAVDEFQHICYAHPELTAKERTYEWHKLEEKYMPWRKYDPDEEFFGRGGYWYHKLHIFLYPFYYINYTLTTMGAMEFKTRDARDHKGAWADYLKLCRCGSSMSYLETLRHAGLMVPFEEGTVEKACSYAMDILRRTIAEG